TSAPHSTAAEQSCAPPTPAPVLDPDHPLVPPRLALRRLEREHVRNAHLGGLLADDLEEHLQVISRRQPRVHCTTRTDELQIAIHHRIADRDQDKLRALARGR